jgi:hypothetical protein
MPWLRKLLPEMMLPRHGFQGREDGGGEVEREDAAGPANPCRHKYFMSPSNE